MPKVFLAPFIIAGLLFLPSCSNAEAEACVDVRKVRDAYREKASEFRFEYEVSRKSKDSLNQSIAGRNYILAKEQSLKGEAVIVGAPRCFLLEEVEQAEELMIKNEEICARAKDETIFYLDRASAQVSCVEL